VISNPLADPLFLPTASLLGGILGVGLVLLLVARRGRLAGLRQDVLLQRWAVWAIIAPLYSLAVLGGALPMLLLVSLLVGQGLREYSHLVELPPLYRRVVLALGLAMGPLAIWLPREFFEVLPLLLLVGTLQPLLTQDVRTGMTHLAFAALGFAYVPLLLDHLLLIRFWLAGGSGLLLAIGLAVALSDIGAFSVGRLVGKHQLSPLVSPNKTWEGVAGNVLGAALGIWLIGFALPPRVSGPLGLALPIVVAVGAVWGDLVESLLKREFGVKDAGAWLPGFGGLLDRVDSLIVVAPLTYHLVRALSL
jgi:phosphatidate cytidylyltransferase